MKLKRVFALVLMLAMASAVFAAAKQVSDDEIHDKVRLRLASDPVVKGGGIEVEVAEGVVTLRGTVEQPKQKSRAEKLTRKVSGVKKVDNQLKVSPKVAQ